MITIWCKRRSLGAAAIIAKLQEMGHSAQLQVGGRCPSGAIKWGVHGGNKYQELVKLAAAGVPVPAHSLTRDGADWLARKFRHRSGNDLVRGRWSRSRGADYYVQLVTTTREFRVHVYGGKCIRVAMKVPSGEGSAHPMFRTHRLGWKLVSKPEYTRLVPRGMRALAKKAVAALEYGFGAVDVAVKEDGGMVVFEVNSGPGVEGGTIVAYARAIVAGCAT